MSAINSSEQVFERHWTVPDESASLIEFLANQLPQFSKQKLKAALKYGAVWLTPCNAKSKTVRVRRAKKQLYSGEKLHLYYNESLLFDPIVPAVLVADEQEFSIWNKPCGMLSQPSKWCDHRAIVRWVEIFGLECNQLPNRPCFLVHRLDRATNGLIIVAHSKTMAKNLSALFESRKIDKCYSAIVSGEFELTDENARIKEKIDGKDASTIIMSAEFNEQQNKTTLGIRIETGRKHQIRKHLACLGFPVIGDRLYSSNSLISEQEAVCESQKSRHTQTLPDLMLRCCLLKFNFDDEKAFSYQLDHY
jgi:tRNA pseudouridine32 synthase/23S rRNA pseudouridine746 synthase